MKATTTAGIRVHWRWLVESPLLLAVWACSILVALTACAVIGALRRADDVRARTGRVMARLCAEEVMLAAAGGGAPAPGTFTARCGVRCDLRAGSGEGAWMVTAALPDGSRHVFRCEHLDGGAAPALALAFAVAGDRPMPPGVPEPVRIAADDFPRSLLPARVPGSARGAGLELDAALALLRLATGTDADDFVLGRGRDHCRLTGPADGMVVVDGNLWVDAAPTPLTVELERDTTLLVRGNIYLGRSIAVEGTGRLWLVALAEPGMPLRDLDHNGRWSPGDELLVPGPFRGPMEGAGGVWLGLPGARCVALEVAAGLVVGGELHLAADAAHVSGTLLVRHGVTAAAAGGHLRASGVRCPDVRREQVPGFPPAGPPRPGRLLPVTVY